jgi:hypothetical protein
MKRPQGPKAGTGFTLFVFLALLALAAGRNARADEVWRCGAAGNQYSDAPCTESGRLLRVADERSSDQVAASRRLAAREQALAERWRAERVARELAGIAASSTAVAFSTGPGMPALTPPRSSLKARRAPKSSQRGARDAEADTWRAVAPSSPRAPG